MLALMFPFAAVFLGALLGLAPVSRDTVRVARTQSCPLAWPVLDVAVLGDDRFLLLLPTRVLLSRLAQNEIAALSEVSLPEPYAVVRAPAGVIRMSDDRLNAWLLTNVASGALLVAFENDRLVSRLHADALPWPGSSMGVSFQEGTNLLKASLDLLGDGPFLSLAPIGPGLAVMDDGRLKIAAPEGGRTVDDLRVGPTLAPLFESLVASSTSRPPGASDKILVLAPDDSGFQIAQSLSLEHSVRALGSRVQGATALLAVVTEAADGSRLFHVLELRGSARR
jgi:hypothetical protein